MPYEPIVSPPDLKTHIHPEIMEEVSRDDDDITSQAILGAIDEVQLYLSRYDMVQLFGDPSPGVDVAAVFTSNLLTSLVKDVACWHLIKLGNPNLDYDRYLDIYKMAINTLKRIQSGEADPKFPYLNTQGETAPKGNAVFASSIPKRNNNF